MLKPCCCLLVSDNIIGLFLIPQYNISTCCHQINDVKNYTVTSWTYISIMLYIHYRHYIILVISKVPFMQLRFGHFHFFFCIIVAVEFQEKWPGNLCVLLQSGNREIFKGLKKLEIKRPSILYASLWAAISRVMKTDALLAYRQFMYNVLSVNELIWRPLIMFFDYRLVNVMVASAHRDSYNWHVLGIYSNCHCFDRENGMSSVLYSVYSASNTGYSCISELIIRDANHWSTVKLLNFLFPKPFWHQKPTEIIERFENTSTAEKNGKLLEF